MRLAANPRKELLTLHPKGTERTAWYKREEA